MGSYGARLDKVEHRMGSKQARFVWVNPGETQIEAMTRYVNDRKLEVAPSTLLAVAKDRAAGRLIYFVGWQSTEASK